MKYKIAIACLFLVSISASKLQAGTFDQGDNGINIGIGFGGYYGSYVSGLSSRSESPVISFSFEHGQWKAGPGVISWGIYAGFKTLKNSQRHSFTNYEYTERWTYIIVGPRAAWHWTEIPVEKLDVYGGVMAGLYIESYKYEDNDPFDNDYYDTYDAKSRVYPSLFVGARYMFAGGFGAFAEAGYGASFLSLGLCFKF